MDGMGYAIILQGLVVQSFNDWEARGCKKP